MINVFVEKIFNTLPDTLAILIVLGFSLLALALALLISFALIKLILRIKWQSQTVRKIIRIKNQGNISEKFLVRFNIPKDELRYQCSLEGQALQNSGVVQKILVKKPIEETYGRGEVGAVASQFSHSEMQHDQIQTIKTADHPKESNDAKKKVADGANKAKEKSKKGLGFIRLISGIFSSLGAILPGSLGKSLKEKSSELQKASQDASNKMQMPEQKLRSVDQLKGQVGQIKPKEKGQKEAPLVVSTTESVPLQSNQSINKTNTQRTPLSSEIEFREVSLENYLETPVLKPADVLNLELSINPLHPYRSGEYFIEAFIRQLDSKNDVLEEEPIDTKTQFTLFIKGLSPIFWMLSFLLVLCTVVINSTWAVLFISWLARFVI